MGCLQSKSQEDRLQERLDKAINRDQATAMRKQEEVIKLLLLGAGESGKSTIFKQVRAAVDRPTDGLRGARRPTDASDR